MSRIALFLVLFGLVTTWIGYDMWRKIPPGPESPVRAEVADLEASQAAPATWLELGPHRRRYDHSLVLSDTGGAVRWDVYPIQSPTLAAASEVAEAKLAQRSHLERMGGVVDRAHGRGEPDLQFTVMVKTTAYRDRSQVPRKVADSDGVRGRVLEAGHFGSDFAQRLQRDFGIAASSVIVIEDGASPGAERARNLLVAAGGAALVAAGIALAVWSGRRGTPAPPTRRQAPPATPPSR